MTVLIDPPLWPAHGTLWSHLVSDVSLDELHSFAARLGLGRRGFDLDHYDIPAERYDDAVAGGALPVEGRELVGRLAGSGLRVRGRGRPALAALRRRWLDLMPGEYAIGDELLARWREPRRVYHGPRHLAECLDAADVLLGSAHADSPGATPPGERVLRRRAREARVVLLALWFHDAVHTGTAGRDEADSAALAERLLAGCLPDEGTAHFGDTQVASVAHAVRVTADHDPGPWDWSGALVSDADLAILAAAPPRYAAYVREVRAEYSHVPDDAFRAGRTKVVADLLARGGDLYRTPFARERWLDRATANLRGELTELTGRRG